MVKLKPLMLILLFIVVLELCCRVDDYLQWSVGLFSISSADNLTVIDDFGKHGRPSAVYQKWRLNPQGFRNDFDVKEQKEAGQIRVFVLGASESFGLYESEGKDYPSQLKALLKTRGFTNVEVINAACAGMSPPRVKIFFERFIAKFKPDLVIYYPSPAFYLDEYPPTGSLPKQAKQAPFFQFRILPKTKTVVKKFLPEFLKIKIYERMVDNSIQNKSPNWLWKFAPIDRVKLFEADVRLVCDKVIDSGSKILLATHANSLESPDKDFGYFQYVSWRSNYPRATYDCFVEFETKANKTIVTIGKDLHLDVLNIDKYIPKTKEYFSDFVHFTDLGAEVFAKLAAEAIINNISSERRLLPKANENLVYRGDSSSPY